MFLLQKQIQPYIWLAAFHNNITYRQTLYHTIDAHAAQVECGQTELATTLKLRCRIGEEIKGSDQSLVKIIIRMNSTLNVSNCCL